MSDLQSTTTADLLELVSTSDPELLIRVAHELAQRGDNRAVPQLIKLLRLTSDNTMRNSLALALSDLKAPEAFNVLVELIKDTSTSKSRGTLLYALGAYDCGSILSVLVEQVIEGSYEVSQQALSLIHGIETEIDKQAWENCTNKIRSALSSTSQERLPLLLELLSLFEDE